MIDISCGEEHAALITKDKALYTWGYGHDGQLGIFSKIHLATPVKVESVDHKVSKVVCGGGHTAVITKDGELLLFGRGRDGQLGRSDIIESIAVSRPTPSKVDFFSVCEMMVDDVALGTNHSIALTTKKNK